MFLEFYPDIHFEGGQGRVGCAPCGWVTFLASPPRAWEDAEDFISKFPPIMRIRKGDKVMVYNKISTVRKVNMDLATIYLEGIYSEPFYCHDIQKWPWELEQKGGGK